VRQRTVGVGGRACELVWVMALAVVAVFGATARAQCGGQPSNLQASVCTSASQVQVTWSFGQVQFGHEVLRNTTNNLATATVVATVPVGTLSYLDSPPALGGSAVYYWVRIACVGATAVGPVIGRITGPAVPGVQVSTQCESATVTWNAYPLASSYEILRSFTNDPGTAAVQATVAPPTTTGTVTKETYGLNTYYWVRAVLAAGCRTPLPAAGVVSTPTSVAPSITSLTSATTCPVTLTWNSPGSLFYIIFRETTPTFNPTNPALDESITSTYTDSTVVPGTTYYYFVVRTTFAPGGCPGGPWSSAPVSSGPISIPLVPTPVLSVNPARPVAGEPVVLRATAPGAPVGSTWRWKKDGQTLPIAGLTVGGLGTEQLSVFSAGSAAVGSYVVELVPAALGCAATTSNAVAVSLGCAADFNADGVRQPADIFAFLNAYFAGCP
jgi:hypothetical protein